MQCGIRGNGKYLDVIWDLTALRGAGFVKILACSRLSVSGTREEMRSKRSERTKKREARSTDREPGTGYQNLSTGCEKFFCLSESRYNVKQRFNSECEKKWRKRIINQVIAMWRLLWNLTYLLTYLLILFGPARTLEAGLWNLINIVLHIVASW